MASSFFPFQNLLKIFLHISVQFSKHFLTTCHVHGTTVKCIFCLLFLHFSGNIFFDYLQFVLIYKWVNYSLSIFDIKHY